MSVYEYDIQSQNVRNRNRNKVYQFCWFHRTKFLKSPFPFHRRMETLTIRQTLDNLRLDLSVDDEEEDPPKEEETPGQVTKV